MNRKHWAVLVVLFAAWWLISAGFSRDLHLASDVFGFLARSGHNLRHWLGVA